MFENLSKRLTTVLDRLKNRGVLNEGDVNDVLREVRIALLEADVALPVVKHFIEDVKKVAIGQDVLKSITPGQLIIKIVYDHLVSLLGAEVVPLKTNAVPPLIYLMVGLQGSGKTTSSAKIARFLRDKLSKKPLLAGLDVYRPAAQKQLEILAEQSNITSLPIVSGESPLEIAKRSIEFAKKQGYDAVILDTAGRLHIDDALMDEVAAIQQMVNPIETLLVTDAMMGQDAVTMAKAFHTIVPLTGLILTRIDGDARGGAALSLRYATGQPIKLMGVGEKLDQLEVFDPKRIADRILDRGDVVGLVEKAMSAFEDEEAEKLNARMQRGQFDMNDFLNYFSQMLKMGGMGSLLGMIPGIGKIKDQLASKVDDRMIKRQMGIIQSMTPKERRDPKLLNAGRKRRIAKGSGVEVSEINRLLKQYESTRDMMKRFKKMGIGGLMKGGLKNLFGK